MRRIFRIPDEEDIKVEVEEEIEHTATGGRESDDKESRSYGIGSCVWKDGDEEPRQRALGLLLSLAHKYVILDGTIHYQYQGKGKGKDALRRCRGGEERTTSTGALWGLPHPHMVVFVE